MFAKEIYKDHYGSSEFYLSNDLKKTIEKYESLKDNKFTNDIKY